MKMSLKKILAKITTSMKNTVIVEQITGSSVTANAGATVGSSFNTQKSGYSFAGIVGYDLGYGGMHMVSTVINATGFTLWMTNNSSTSHIVTPIARVLFVKNL